MVMLISKSGAVIFRDKKLLIVKPKDKDFWIFVGGKVEKNETPKQALRREVKEELGVEVARSEFYFKSHREQAAGQAEGVLVEITVYLTEIKGEPQASQEIEELYWLTRDEFTAKKFKLGSILEKYAIPKLIKGGLM